METFLTIKKDSKHEEFVIKEKNGANEISYSFNTKDELVNYLKDNIPVSDKNFKLNIDSNINGNDKILLKHSTEKAAMYQKKHGFDTRFFEQRRDALSILQETESDIEKQSDKIKSLLNINSNENSAESSKIEKVMLVLLAETSIELYNKLFTGLQGANDEQKIMNANERVLANLRDNFNLLIKNDYTSHNYKNNNIDIITLRNNISKIFMTKLNMIKKLNQQAQPKTEIPKNNDN